MPAQNSTKKTRLATTAKATKTAKTSTGGARKTAVAARAPATGGRAGAASKVGAGSRPATGRKVGAGSKPVVGGRAGAASKVGASDKSGAAGKVATGGKLAAANRAGVGGQFATVSTKKKTRLGRGLEALLGVSAAELTGELAPPIASTGSTRTPTTARPKRENTGLSIEISQMAPSPFQPRRQFQAEAIEELAASIKEHGILQPIVVRKSASGGWEIVAGERRWRAAQIAGLKKVPVVERNLTDAQTMSIALVENLQRVDLNPVEKARGIARLHDHSGLAHQEIAGLLGCSRVAVTNLLRLLKLQQEVLDMLSAGKMQAGHARALLSLDGATQLSCARKIVREGMSSTAVEKMVRNKLKPPGHRADRQPDGDTRALERTLCDRLGAQVNIAPTRRGGRIVINCPSAESLDAVIDKLKNTR